jgi:mannose-1-phosphate guanylyltransferase
VLLGITARSPETEYGWIEPGETIPMVGLRRIRRLWEKPTPTLARGLMERGCFWNSFVIVARVPALLALFRLAVPDLWSLFASVRTVLGSAGEPDAIERVYRQIEPASFSASVLNVCRPNLGVLPVTGDASDEWGQPVMPPAALTGLGQPRWAEAVGRT